MKLKKGDLLIRRGIVPVTMVRNSATNDKVDTEVMYYVQACKGDEVWVRDPAGEKKTEILTVDFIDRWYDKTNKGTYRLYKALFL